MSLREAFAKCRSFIIFAAIFSFFVKLLSLSPVLFMLTVFDRVLSTRSVETLIVLFGLFIFATAIDAILDALTSQLLIRFGDTVFMQLRNVVLGAVLKVKKQGGINNHALEDLENIRSFLSGGGMKAFFDIPWIPIFLFVLWAFHPSLALLAGISSLILFGLTFLEEIVAAKKQAQASQKTRESNDFISAVCQNAELVTALSMQGNIQKRWETLNNDYLGASFQAKKRTAAVVAISKFVRTAVLKSAMAWAAFLVISPNANISTGVILASTIVMGKALGPILHLLSSWRSFVNFRMAYKRLDTLLKENQQIGEGFRNLPPSGQLSVENILFFLDKDRTLLRGINFRLEAGSVLGVVGASASGKTTLAKLMVGIFQPSDGVIRLDGVDVFQWSQNGLGEYIGYLPQELQLFKGTVAENIARMGDAYQCVEAVVEAAKRARVHDMIVRLPKGYDTEIGEGGRILSGGQKRQIGLARALFGRPSFVVLDEPNSNLDGRSELVLLEVIRDMKAAGVTVVIIAHKPSILQDADQLLVLGQGKQLMFGPREEVMRRLGEVSDMDVAPEKTKKKVLSMV
jgi:PrtD family type I secretion system ABC transporter